MDYRNRLLALVGDRDPLDVLARTPPALAEIVRTHSTAMLRARPSERAWSAAEIIGHLVDGEWTYGYRLRLVLSEDAPAILGTQQEAWVARQRHNDRDPAELAGAFRALRDLNLAAWSRVSPADLQRVGRHNERGEEALDVMLRMMAGHDLSHLGQIERAIRAVGDTYE